MSGAARPPAPSKADAQAALDRVLGRPHRLVRTRHAKLRRGTRNFDDQDARRVLDKGRVTAVEWHEGFNQWLYVVNGRDIEGDDLSVLVDVDESESEVRIVTGY